MEGQEVEYKLEVDLSNKRQKQQLMFEIIAFLNSNNGKVVIGVNDIGKVVGINPDVELEKYLGKLQKLCLDLIDPSVIGLIDFEIVTIETKRVIVINVQEGTQKPYYYKPLGLTPKSVYIRFGEHKIATSQWWINNQLEMRSKLVLEDKLSPVQTLTFEQIVQQIQLVKPNFQPEYLKNYGLKCENGYNYCAYMLSEQYKAESSIGYFDKDGDLERILDFSDGNIVNIFLEVEKQLQRDFKFSKLISGHVFRCDGYKVDLKLLREVLINAFIHTNYMETSQLPRIKVYDDRVEIVSIGALHVSEQSFGHDVSNVRNQSLAAVFKECELIEKFGIGSKMIINSPEVKTEFLPDAVLITIYFKYDYEAIFERHSKMSRLSEPRVTYYAKSRPLNEAQNMIVQAIERGINQTSIISHETNLSQSEVEQQLGKLIDLKVIERNGSGQATYYRYIK